MSRKRVVVIGGGAAGMMAAGRAAEAGAEVLLLEKMERPGRKVLISGNRRCNLSNALPMDDFISMFGKNGSFLYPVFRHFSRDALLDFLAFRGVMTRQEPDGRIFPASGRSSDVVEALRQYMADQGVKVAVRSRVTMIEAQRGRITAVKASGKSYTADAVVLASGGASYPQTGSSGDGYKLAATLGHRIVKLRPALVPLVTSGQAAGNLQGSSLKAVRITSFSCRAADIEPSLIPIQDCGRGIGGRKARPPLLESRTGDLIFTHYGISGPAVLLMSLAVVDALENGPVALTIDLFPVKPLKDMQRQLQKTFSLYGRRTLQNVLGTLVPDKLAGAVLNAADVDGRIKANQAASSDREQISRGLKDFRLDVKGVRPLAEAMVTAGGICLDEVDPHTMESRLVKGLYFCGEVLDLDADTGGFNLQAAFSTGCLAGDSASRP